MNFLLKILSGPQKGKTFSIRNGQKVGRNKAHINLNDSKASGLHAQFVKDPSGRLFLMDLGSKNGLLVAGEKHKKVLITESVSILVGNTHIGFEKIAEKLKNPVKKHKYDIPSVKPPAPSGDSIIPPATPKPPTNILESKITNIDAPLSAQIDENTQNTNDSLDLSDFNSTRAEELEAKAAVPEVISNELVKSVSKQEPVAVAEEIEPKNEEASSIGQPMPAPEPRFIEESAASEQVDWQESIIEFLEKTEKKTKDKLKKITAFEKIVELDIQTGPQRKTQWRIGYGPRLFGYNCFEFPIFELGAPELCFSIDSVNGKPYFKTDHPKVVLLNSNSQKTEELSDGDCITINATSIKVRLRNAE